MRIAIVHYHLRPGGVTRVIENAIESLKGGGHEVVVLIGEACPTDSPIADYTRVVDGLGYRASADGLGCEELLRRLREAAGDGIDVWHIHNSSLGKNVIFPDVVAALAGSGEKLLLQIHDFSEDGRPSNFRIAAQSQTLYPSSNGVYYGVLTGRDRNILAYAGVPEERLFLLPNPVSVPSIRSEGFSSPGRLLFYPTRGIRRKNIGEIVFLAAILEAEGVRLASSRAPDNESWQMIHERWREFARECSIPVSLGVVDNPEFGGHSFDAWLATCDAIVTTSITEGFGLAFLEPLLLGKNVVGRDLPEVTSDFKQAGLKFPGLYRALLIPEIWLNVETIRERLIDLLEGQFESYQMKLPGSAGGRALESMKPLTGWLDFGCLEEPFQEVVIRHVVERPASIREIRILDASGDASPAVPWMRKQIDMATGVEGGVKSILHKNYSLESYGTRLNACYDAIATGEAGGFEVDASKILNVFLAPERFHFLKTT